MHLRRGRRREVRKWEKEDGSSSRAKMYIHARAREEMCMHLEARNLFIVLFSFVLRTRNEILCHLCRAAKVGRKFCIISRGARTGHGYDGKTSLFRSGRERELASFMKVVNADSGNIFTNYYFKLLVVVVFCARGHERLLNLIECTLK